jgi:hypothetical protein
MRARSATSWQAHRGEDGQDGSGLARADADPLQRLPRQVQAPDLGILVDVPQDVRELKRPTEMIGEQVRLAVRQPKDTRESRPTALATRSQYRSSFAQSGA